MIDIEVKKKWLEALRSRKYLQGTGSLRKKGDLFCCLGVLCDITDSSKWTLREDYDNEYRYQYGGPYDYHTGILPKTLMYEIGLDSMEMRELASRNDNGFDFFEIADYIAENL